VVKGEPPVRTQPKVAVGVVPWIGNQHEVGEGRRRGLLEFFFNSARLREGPTAKDIAVHDKKRCAVF
jgi:hypothetical protein